MSDIHWTREQWSTIWSAVNAACPREEAVGLPGCCDACYVWHLLGMPSEPPEDNAERLRELGYEDPPERVQTCGDLLGLRRLVTDEEVSGE